MLKHYTAVMFEFATSLDVGIGPDSGSGGLTTLTELQLLGGSGVP